MKKKKHTVLYTRVSTEEQAREGLSLQAQYNYLVNYCEQNGIKNYIHIEDAGISGTTTKRNGYQKLIKLISDNQVETLIYCKGDRLSRNVVDHYNLINLCKEKSVKMVSTFENVNTETADGRYMAGLFLLSAQQESERISERVKFAYEGALYEGKYPFGGKLPLGIIKSKNKEIKYSKEAHIIKEIFNLYIDENWSLNSIYELMKEKYPSKWNWNKNSIGKIISNTLYQGYVEYNGIKYQLAEPLIKPQTITKTNKKRKHNKRIRKNNYIYKSLVFYDNEIMKTTCTSKYIKLTKETVTYKYYYHGDFKISEIKLNKLVNKEFEKRGKRKYTKSKAKLNILHTMFLNGDIDNEEYKQLKQDLKAINDLPQLDLVKRIDILSKDNIKITYKRK
jgi:DNA invertase Pin-like site-specific DNA recombinase